MQEIKNLIPSSPLKIEKKIQSKTPASQNPLTMTKLNVDFFNTRLLDMINISFENLKEHDKND